MANARHLAHTLRVNFSFAISCIMSVAGLVLVSSAHAQIQQTPEFVPGEVIVKLKGN